MDIRSIVVERADANSFCGLLTVRDMAGASRIWWSVERIDEHRVRVGFVQGERADWLAFVETHAPILSDGILTAIAHRRRLAAIA
ncbi:MAG: hypothetical protein H7338_13945 [Candidatus Sericytochromatia bacterium]|nr:hypothetical protein [Candidatus Sericytochromatia bacterium]